MLVVKREKEDLEEDDKVKVYTFESHEEMLKEAVKNETKNCFGLDFKKVDRDKFDYEVMYSFS